MKMMGLLGGIVTGALSLLHGCGCSHTETRQEATAEEWLRDRKAVLEETLPEAEAQAVPEDFYSYSGFRDWYRMPLVFPWQLQAIDVTDSFRLERHNGKGSVREPNQSSEPTSPLVELSDLSFDGTMLLFKLLFKKQGGEEYGIFGFEDGGFEFFATEAELWDAARSRGFRGLGRLVSANEAYDSYWTTDMPWCFDTRSNGTEEGTDGRHE